MIILFYLLREISAMILLHSIACVLYIHALIYIYSPRPAISRLYVFSMRNSLWMECWNHSSLFHITFVATLLIFHAKAYVFSSIFKSLCLAIWVQWVLLKSWVETVHLLCSAAVGGPKSNFLATPTAPKGLNREIWILKRKQRPWHGESMEGLRKLLDRGWDGPSIPSRGCFSWVKHTGD